MAEKFFDILEESSPAPPDIKRKLDGKHRKDVRTRGRVVCVQLLFSLPDLRDHSMLRGMTGYQLTPEDMEFLKMMLEEKMVAKLKVAAVAVLWRHWYQNKMNNKLLLLCCGLSEAAGGGSAAAAA